MARPIHSTGPAGRFPGRVTRNNLAPKSAGWVGRCAARARRSRRTHEAVLPTAAQPPRRNRHSGGGRQPPPAHQDLHLPSSGAETWPTANGRHPVWLTSGWCRPGSYTVRALRNRRGTPHRQTDRRDTRTPNSAAHGTAFLPPQRQTSRAPERGRGHPGRTAPAGPVVPGASRYHSKECGRRAPVMVHPRCHRERARPPVQR